MSTYLLKVSWERPSEVVGTVKGSICFDVTSENYKDTLIDIFAQLQNEGFNRKIVDWKFLSVIDEMDRCFKLRRELNLKYTRG